MAGGVACGQEQGVILPVAAGLALTTAYVIAVGAAKKTKNHRSNLDGQLRQSLELCKSGESGGNLEEPSTLSVKYVTDALEDSRVLIFDLSDYQAARCHLQWASRMLAGACLATLATPGSTDLFYSVSRIFLVGLLWVHHEWSSAGLRRGAAALAERFGESSRSASLLHRFQRLSGTDVWLMRALLFSVHFGLCVVFLVFETAHHPRLNDEACTGMENLFVTPALLAERSSALTMTAAWLLGGLTYAALLRCEACLWVSPRAEEVLSGALQTHRGCLPTGCGLELAEALCGASGHALSDAMLHELLNGFGIAVLSGSSVLHPSAARGRGQVNMHQAPTPLANDGKEERPLALPSAQLTQVQDFAELKAEIRTDLRHSLDASEARMLAVLRSNQESLQRVLTKASGRRETPSADKQDAVATERRAAAASAPSLPPSVSRKPGAECVEFEMPGEAPLRGTPRSRLSTETTGLRRGLRQPVSDNTTLEALARLPVRVSEPNLEITGWEKPPQPGPVREVTSSVNSVEKPRPPRIARTPSRRSVSEASSAIPPVGAGVGAFPGEAEGSSSRENSDKDLLEPVRTAGAHRASSRRIPATSVSQKSPPPMVRAAPPPSRPSLSARSGLRAERPSRPASKTQLDADRRMSRYEDLDRKYGPDEGSSELLEPDLHDANPNWSGVNAF